MAENLRQTEILRLAAREGQVQVDDLAQRLSTSPQTIRKDLTELSQSGQLKRVHGGAILPMGTTNIAYAARRDLHADAKARIAAACAAHIPNNVSVFLNIGTSTEAVARALLGHRDLMVITNNLNVANILAANPNCEVVVAGGVLRRADGGLTGSMTMQVIEQFKTDIAVIGCSALGTDGDILDFDVQEVSVSQAILRRSRSSFLVADASKFERHAPVMIGSMRQVDHIFTDVPILSPLKETLSDWQTAVTVS
ncbi:MAG: DeoR/GlpR family DNA-binding transcription regulator [Litoreibacter sp.]